MVYTNLFAKLIWLGAHISELKWHADRPKATGCMWGGSAILHYGGFIFRFKLWHHGRDEETAESLAGRNAFRLEQIMVPALVNTRDSHYFDFYWHGWTDTNGSVWIHPIGWFGAGSSNNFHYVEQGKVYEKLLAEMPNKDAHFPIDKKHYLVPHKLIELGFVKII